MTPSMLSHGARFVVVALITAGPVRAAGPDDVRTIGDVEAQALAANHDVRLARLAVDGARAGILQADTRPNPVLSWNGASYSPTGGLGGGNLASKRVDQIVRVDQTFERGDKRALRVELAQRQALGKAVDLEDQRRQILLAARDAYIDLVLAERRSEIIAETGRAYEGSLDAAGKRVKAGDLARADLDRLRVDGLRARTDAEAASGERLRAQIALAQVVAADTDPTRLHSDGRWPRFVVEAPSSPTEDVVDRRPDLVSARLAVDAAASSIAVARAQRTRDVTFGIQLERYPGPGGTGNTVGVGVSIPLFFGNDYRGDVAHAVADRDAAEENAARVRDAARAEVATALQGLDTASRKVATYHEGLLQAARAAADASEFAYTRGAIGVMDVLDARRTLLATRLDALAAEADHARAQAAVAAALTRVAGGIAP